MLPGVRPDWCDGVARLATMPVPLAIHPPRWTAFVSTSARLLHSHGAALHEAGWGTVEVWGLHPTAPGANPPGWGPAWLLGAAGDVLDVSPGAIGMRFHPNGVRLALHCRAGRRGGIMPAWKL